MCSFIFFHVTVVQFHPFVGNVSLFDLTGKSVEGVLLLLLQLRLLLFVVLFPLQRKGFFLFCLFSVLLALFLLLIYQIVT